MVHWKYDERLEYLGLRLIRLERQRVRSDLIETLEIMKGHCDVHHDLDLTAEKATLKIKGRCSKTHKTTEFG